MRKHPAIIVLPVLLAVAVAVGWSACTAPQSVAKPPPAAGSTLAKTVAAPDVKAAEFDRGFRETIHPFVETYCTSCHGSDKPKAELDLSTFTTFASVKKNLNRWSEVLERIKAEEMPPDEAKKHPDEAQVRPVVAWLESLRTYEAERNAGEPGVVLARRLSNAEYDYTIRDLTGVDIRPTREFPVDPANGAGFDNSGESLAMSPALIKKYLDAARLVAEHIVFNPRGFVFAPHPMVTEEDRDKYAVHRIVDFYRRQSLDYADFFAAAWRFQHRAALGRPSAKLAEIAKEAGLSPKYLEQIWSVVTARDEEVGPMAALQARWRNLPPPAAGREPKGVRAGCVALRDFIVELRPYVQREFPNLVANGKIVAAGSQTLVLWKDQQYAANRMRYAGNAQRIDMSEYEISDPRMLIPAGEKARELYEDSFQRFCETFPDAFYIAERARMFLTNPKEIASDLAGHRLLTAGFHSQMGYFRDDEPLCALVLDQADKRELDALWAKLDFITLAPLRQFKQFIWFERAEPPSFMITPEFNLYRSEDDDITSEAKIKELAKLFVVKAEKLELNETALKAVRDYFVTINGSIRALEQARTAAEPSHLQSLLTFAERAYRRPLLAAERDDILSFYRKLRAEKLDHEGAIRDSVVSLLMAPGFSYRFALPKADQPVARPVQPLTEYELANRLSYFLWSTMPDQELMARAAEGDLHRPEVLVAQVRRMLQDDRVRGLAKEFGGNWLDIRRFEEHNAVDRERFPTFTNELREAMFEEPVRFFIDIVKRNGSVLDFVYGDYTFVNPILAQHYGMPVPTGAAHEWAKIDGAGKFSRGGVLPMAAFLTKNAPGLRTSPVKRGNWVVSKLLGERIPPPPPNVPVIPTDETKMGDLTVRQTLARHRDDKACASCHDKIDSFGLVFEGFGPVGEVRTLDLAGRPVDTRASFPDGSEGTGLAGLRTYFRTKVQDEYLDNLCRKMMVYALGRSLILSDDLVVADLHKKLTAGGYHFNDLIEGMVTSRQFLTKRTAPDPESE